jgi:hypothetical protein
MRTNISFLVALTLSVLACEQDQDLGANNPNAQAGTSGSSGSSAAGSSPGGTAGTSAGEAGIGGTSPGGAGGAGGASSGSGGSKAGEGGAGSGGSGGTGGSGGSGGSTAGVGGTSSGGVGGTSSGGAGGTSSAGVGGTSSAGGSGGAGGTSSAGTGGQPAGGSGGAGGTSSGGGTGQCSPSAVTGQLTKLADTPFDSLDLVIGKNSIFALDLFGVNVSPSTSAGGDYQIPLPLDELHVALAVIDKPFNIPSTWLSHDWLKTLDISTTGEQLFVQRIDGQPGGNIDSTAPETFYRMPTDGKNLYWSLQKPALVVELSLESPASERVVVSYEEDSLLIPTALAMDKDHLYWSVGKRMSKSDGRLDFVYGSKLYRAKRGDNQAIPEEITYNSVPIAPITSLALDGENIYLGYLESRFAAVPKAGGFSQLLQTSDNSYAVRFGPTAMLDGFLYYTERKPTDPQLPIDQTPCTTRLRRVATSNNENQLYPQGELLVNSIPFVSVSPVPYGALIAHEGKIIFNLGDMLDILNYAPTAPTCQSCNTTYETQVNNVICKDAEPLIGNILVCDIKAGSPCDKACKDSFFKFDDEPASAECKACLEKTCPAEVAACKAN